MTRENGCTIRLKQSQVLPKAFSHFNQFQCTFTTMRVECAFNSLQAISHYNSHQRLGHAKVVTTSVRVTLQSRVEWLEKWRIFMPFRSWVFIFGCYTWNCGTSIGWIEEEGLKDFLGLRKFEVTPSSWLWISCSPHTDRRAFVASWLQPAIPLLHVLRYALFAKHPSIHVQYLAFPTHALNEGAWYHMTLVE